MEHLSLMGVLAASRWVTSGVLRGGPALSGHPVLVMTTDLSIINSSMEKAMEHPLSELGRLGKGGAGSWVLHT